MRYFIGIALFLLINLSGIAQESFFEQPAFSISIYTHSIGIPFKHIIKKPLNFGLALGAEFQYPNQGKERHSQRVEVGCFFHKHLQKVVWMKTDYVRRFRNGGGASGELNVGLGYMRDIKVNQTFKLGKEGKYLPMKSSQAGGLITSLGIGGAYQFDDNNEHPISPFLRYEGWLQLPYTKLMPFMPHSFVHLGSRFQL